MLLLLLLVFVFVLVLVLTLALLLLRLLLLGGLLLLPLEGVMMVLLVLVLVLEGVLLLELAGLSPHIQGVPGPPRLLQLRMLLLGLPWLALALRSCALFGLFGGLLLPPFPLRRIGCRGGDGRTLAHWSHVGAVFMQRHREARGRERARVEGRLGWMRTR